MSEQQVKPYRAIKYDGFDTKYATELKISFDKLDLKLKNEFNLFTENLMIETQINRYSLLDAISDFEKKVRSKKSNESIRHYESIRNENENENENESISHYLWKQFTENAFNYRPYNL
jgi:hypothetical protein